MESKVWNLIETSTLVYGAEWEGAKSSVRAKVFGKMVELARDRVQFYRSDLFHDALWLNEAVNGPVSFDWIARESGTFIGESTRHVKDDEWANSVRYRLEIVVEDNLKWVLRVYEAVSEDSLDVSCTGYKTEWGISHDWGTCPVHEDSDGTYTEDDQGNWHNVQAQISWTDRHAALDVMECDMAMSAAGCIYHPAPVGGWYSEIPTLRNENTRKENVMESILGSLRDKLDEATQTRDDLEDLQRELENAIETANNNIDSLEEAINALDISLEDIEFEADVRFDGSY